ncbi:MAG: two-component system, OmpR family, phosphate regulon sensor histidine kinase PhoR [Candidatus Poribacteria bacterium]|nr:two-component system, OmpR family, phosphate regulon sensor histidine kinase PhoR [Candidatus Poribacteria bacterium]
MIWSTFARIFVGFVIVIAILTVFFFFALGDQRDVLTLSVYIVGIAVSIIISIIFSALVSKGVSLPLDSLKTKVQSGSQGITQGIAKKLMENFNLTFDQVNIMVSDIFDRKDELNSILSSLQEAILVLDNKGKITLYNDLFKKIAQTDSIEGQFYGEVIREPEFKEIVEKITKEKNNVIQEVTLMDRKYIFKASFIDSSEKFILTFFDIT